MIAPACFPVTGAENIVNIKLLQALSTSDEFCIDLISRQREWENYPSDDLDYFGVKINYLGVLKVSNSKNVTSIFQHIMTYLKTGIFYRGCHWAYPAIRLAEKLVNKNQYDYVLTKNSPSFLVGYYLKKKYSLKWVATWNDPFPSEKYPEPYGRGLDSPVNSTSTHMIDIMRKADIHIFPNDRIMNYMQNYIHANKEKCLIAPHAAITKNHVVEYEKSPILRFVHSGNLSTPRDPFTFLKAYRAFIDNHSGIETIIAIMGKSNEMLADYIKQFELGNYVRIVEPKKYSESLTELNKYDVAVIIEANCKEGIFLPTKVSDFMQMHIPIFAISPSKGVLNDLYNSHDIPFFADVTNPDKILEQLEIIYSSFLKGELTHDQRIKREYMCDSITKIYKEL